MKIQIKVTNNNALIEKIVSHLLDMFCTGFEVQVEHETVTLVMYAGRIELAWFEKNEIPYLDMTYAEDS